MQSEPGVIDYIKDQKILKGNDCRENCFRSSHLLNEGNYAAAYIENDSIEGK